MDFEMYILLAVIVLMLFCVGSNKNLKFKNDSQKEHLYMYYLKYRLPDDNDYYFANVKDYDDIIKRTNDFLLHDFERYNTLDSNESMKILNSEDSNVMLGLGDIVQVWYKPKAK